MTAAPPSVSLVVPAYNEEARIGALLETLTSSAESDLEAAGLRYLEAVVVDDGSTDATDPLLRAAAAEDPRIRPVLGHTDNRGKGAAVAAGVRAARGELVLVVDVDLSTPLTDARGLAAALAEGYDGAIGSRDLAGGRVDAPRHREVLGAGFNFAVRRLTGLDFADTQCGFKLLPRRECAELVREQISEGFAYDVELLMRARLAGLTIAEVPVSYVHDHRSRVRVGRAALSMTRDVIRISWRLRRGGRGSRRTPPPGSAPPA